MCYCSVPILQVLHPVISRMPTIESKKPGEPNSTGYTPGDETFTRLRNWFVLLMGNMNQEGIEQYANDIDLRNEEADCKKCEKRRDYLLQYSEHFKTPHDPDVADPDLQAL